MTDRKKVMAGKLDGCSATAYTRANKRKTGTWQIIFNFTKLLRKPWPCTCINIKCIVPSHIELFHVWETAAYRRCLGRTILASVMFHEESCAFCRKRQATEGRLQHSGIKPSGRSARCCSITVECEPAQILRMVLQYQLHVSNDDNDYDNIIITIDVAMASDRNVTKECQYGLKYNETANLRMT